MYAYENVINGLDSRVQFMGAVTGLTTIATAPTPTSVLYLTDIILMNGEEDAQTLELTQGLTSQFTFQLAAGGGVAHAFRKPLRMANAGTISGTNSGTAVNAIFIGFWLPN